MAAKILIVEDEEKLARFTELELQHENYEVRKAFEGRAALEEALKNDYDLILLDIMLPGLSGMEVLRRLRQEKNTPVILLTARDSVMDKVAGLDAGAVDYITKPFAIEELLARIRVALKFRSPGAEKTAAAEEGVLSWKSLRLDDGGSGGRRAQLESPAPGRYSENRKLGRAAHYPHEPRVSDAENTPGKPRHRPVPRNAA